MSKEKLPQSITRWYDILDAPALPELGQYALLIVLWKQWRHSVIIFSQILRDASPEGRFWMLNRSPSDALRIVVSPAVLDIAVLGRYRRFVDVDLPAVHHIAPFFQRQ